MSNRTRKSKRRSVYGNQKKSSSEDSIIVMEEPEEIGFMESIRNAILPPKVNNWVRRTLFPQKEEQHSEYSSFASFNTRVVFFIAVKISSRVF